jgi:hypothetical protein
MDMDIVPTEGENVLTVIDDEVRHNIRTEMVNSTENLVYTVLYDYCNAMISKGVDSKLALDTAGELAQSWLNNHLKMRKRPAPRATKPRQPKAEAIDVKAASSRVSRKALTDHAEWIYHPETNKLMYTKSFQLKTGYPVKNVEGKIVGVITEDGVTNLTANDVRLAVSRGYNIDNTYLDKLENE